ncbi:hypothetical protein F5890DRAFT_1555526 [Lentinula detonsa]|uniref:Uncharacterized protein n=1 Tax=Lentinula detonsa TaxID=2804962 RepID=A0AA38PW95_9AGAR|nr:hypothetical protein F5890DRAFT_1555526 [Lentinula detonsa]
MADSDSNALLPTHTDTTMQAVLDEIQHKAKSWSFCENWTPFVKHWTYGKDQISDSPTYPYPFATLVVVLQAMYGCFIVTEGYVDMHIWRLARYLAANPLPTIKNELPYREGESSDDDVDTSKDSEGESSGDDIDTLVDVVVGEVGWAARDVYKYMAAVSQQNQGELIEAAQGALLQMDHQTMSHDNCHYRSCGC